MACVRICRLALHNLLIDQISVVVQIGGKQVTLVKGVKFLKKGITLKKLPTGTYKISIVATVLKQHLSGSQTYKSWGHPSKTEPLDCGRA